VSVAIQGLLPEELATQLNCKVSEIGRVVAAVHQRDKQDLGEPMNQVSNLTRQRLLDACYIGKLEVARSQNSTLDPFKKFVLRTNDGHLIETVRIPLEKPGRYCVCVSSQVGCGMGCKFCKTAQAGLFRNLSAWEIVEQVRLVRQSLPPSARVRGVVFQGMGEPLANLDAVIQAIRVLSHPTCQSIDQKAITLCTSGIARGIARAQATQLRVRIGLSIGSAIPALRAQLMPIEKHQPLCDAVEALINYSRSASQSQMLAYTLLSGVNCGASDAAALRELALDIGQRSGRMPRLSLIAYNPIGPLDPFVRASEAEAENFRQQLISAGFPVIRRYSGGADIDAACGQLARGL
jgi:23S rRNA (adenine2503-C2)-methyltransferase